jgi:hypothetical protein
VTIDPIWFLIPRDGILDSLHKWGTGGEPLGLVRGGEDAARAQWKAAGQDRYVLIKLDHYGRCVTCEHWWSASGDDRPCHERAGTFNSGDDYCDLWNPRLD